MKTAMRGGNKWSVSFALTSCAAILFFHPGCHRSSQRSNEILRDRQLCAMWCIEASYTTHPHSFPLCLASTEVTEHEAQKGACVLHIENAKKQTREAAYLSTPAYCTPPQFPPRINQNEVPLKRCRPPELDTYYHTHTRASFASRSRASGPLTRILFVRSSPHVTKSDELVTNTHHTLHPR